jgi:arabinan endo-1,5-alpha-L-arabinosidase
MCAIETVRRNRIVPGWALLLALAACRAEPEASTFAVEPQPGAANQVAPSATAVTPDPSAPTATAPSETEGRVPLDLAPGSESATTRTSDAGRTASDAGEQAADGDRCDVGRYDPSAPPRALTLSGNLGAHDPVVIAAGGRYHYFSTGNGISVKTSDDLLRWSQQPEIFPTTPAWFQQQVPAYEPRNIWAPDISSFGGQYHLYYSVSSFGSNRSCIGHATRADLTAGAWADHEAVFCSNPPGRNDNFNAIDPNVVLDESGVPWLAFGSFWSGIKLIRLNPSGERDGTELVDLASRGGGAIEAPFLVRRCGYYYLFVSFDACCRGADSTYQIRVGRSATLLGPYVDREGTPLLNGGGTPVLQGAGDWVGPGHNAVLFEGTRAYNIYHAYAADTGASQLRIAELVWDDQGWPLSGGP